MSVNSKCNQCSNIFIASWQLQKNQYGKIRRLNFSHSQASAILPLCPICFAKWLKNPSKIVEPVETVETYPS